MNDTSPEIDALITARFAGMTDTERALLALQMFETGQQIVLSSLDPTLFDHQRRRELCWRFCRDALARVAFPEPEQ